MPPRRAAPWRTAWPRRSCRTPRRARRDPTASRGSPARSARRLLRWPRRGRGAARPVARQAAQLAPVNRGASTHAIDPAQSPQRLRMLPGIEARLVHQLRPAAAMCHCNQRPIAHEFLTLPLNRTFHPLHCIPQATALHRVGFGPVSWSCGRNIHNLQRSTRMR